MQTYPHKDTPTYVESGSLLRVTLSGTTSIPMRSIRKCMMFPLDFEDLEYKIHVFEDEIKNI